MAGLFDNMESEDKSRIVELRSLLKEYNRLYYVNNAPAVTDYEFDRLMRELQDLEAQYPEMADPESPTQRVGSDLSKGFRQVAHKYPMLSLDNTYSEQEVVDFLRRVETLLGGEKFEICCELKFDGLSISLIYHNGRLVQAVTRGDGVKGDDVTDNARRISNIPQVLEGTGWPSDFEIRGEVLMPWSSFERLNAEREAQEEPLFANPRNAASGTLKLQNPEIVGKRGLTSYLYYLLGDNLPANGHYENMHAAAGWGFQVSENMKLCSGIEEVMEFIRYWDTERKNLPVATDGIVLKVNSQNQQQRLGFKAKSPRWAIAYKFQAEKALTKLESVTYQVGRTGAVTPVANFEPVQLSGTVVRRATLNNQDFIEKLDLHIGDMVWVEKGGEIIPKITAVELSARGDSSCGEKVRFISHCPECGAPLVRYEGESAHYCTNTSGCAPQIKGRIEHFIGRKAMNIDGIGPETVDMFFQKGMIRDFTDLYGLKEKDISVLERMGNKSAENIVSNIANSISAPFEKVLFAMGLRFVGEVVAKNLARSFKSLDALESASYEQLVAVDEIGDKIAKSVLEYFADPVNREIVSKIKAIGLKTQVDSEIASGEGGRLQGKTIVISGVFSRHSREEYKDMIERNGGKNAGSISAKTSFVLAGDSMGPAKREKAESLGIPLINEDDFLNLLN